MSVLLRAVERSLNLLGISVLAQPSCLKILDDRNNIVVSHSRDEQFVFDETFMSKTENVFVMNFQPHKRQKWELCPQLSQKIKVVSPSKLLLTLLIQKTRDSDSPNSDSDSCHIECVFTKQMNSLLTVINHDIFGTVSTFGSGKRIVEGNGTEHDLEIFRIRLNLIIEKFEKRQPVCKFLSQQNHKSIPVAQILRVLQSSCSSQFASQFNKAITELRALVRS